MRRVSSTCRLQNVTQNLSATSHRHLTHWQVVGTNYTKADSETRSRFALSHEQVTHIYNVAKSMGVHDFFILSTCNRTEFYSSAPAETLRQLVSLALRVSESERSTYFYYHTGLVAVHHFFRVAAGLDSQIVGDYEIVGQVKKSIELARAHRLIGTVTDRVANFAFQASKEIKTHTNLSNGKYSVSYATAEFIKRQPGAAEKILIVGMGATGKSIAAALRTSLPGCRLAITNRTMQRANECSAALSAEVLPFETFREYLSNFDVVVAAAHADRYLIGPSDLKPNTKTTFLDLSIPCVVDPLIRTLNGPSLFSVDDVSVYHNTLMRQRKEEMPKAEQILDTYVSRVLSWFRSFHHRGIILGYWEKTERFHRATGKQPHLEKTLRDLMLKTTKHGYHGCSVLQTVNALIAHSQ